LLVTTVGRNTKLHTTVKVIVKEAISMKQMLVKAQDSDGRALELYFKPYS